MEIQLGEIAVNAMPADETIRTVLFWSVVVLVIVKHVRGNVNKANKCVINLLCEEIVAGEISNINELINRVTLLKNIACQANFMRISQFYRDDVIMAKCYIELQKKREWRMKQNGNGVEQLLKAIGDYLSEKSKSGRVSYMQYLLSQNFLIPEIICIAIFLICIIFYDIEYGKCFFSFVTLVQFISYSVLSAIGIMLVDVISDVMQQMLDKV